MIRKNNIRRVSSIRREEREERPARRTIVNFRKDEREERPARTVRPALRLKRDAREERTTRPSVGNLRRPARRLERDEIIARRSLRARRYEEDEKEDDKAENLIDTMEVADIVDKAVDALKGYDCPEKEYDDEEKENLPESEAICMMDDAEVPVKVDEDGAKIIIDLDDENSVEVSLEQPEEDVDAELAESLEEYFNPEDEEGDDEDKKDKDAKESFRQRKIRRDMEQRMEAFKRRQALERRRQALKRARNEERKEAPRRPAPRGRR